MTEAAAIHQGPLSLLPAATAIALALWSRRTFEPLLGACIVAFLLVRGLGVPMYDTAYSPGLWNGLMDAFGLFVAACYKVVAGPVFGFVLIVCGLMGSLIAILVRTGGAVAFGELLARRVKSGRGAMLAAWVLGIVVFIDDYLNALVVGFSMRRLTDKFGVAREKLAYIVDSTGAPVCVLVPISTWGIYATGLLVQNGLGTAEEGLATFVRTIPYNLYAWAALALVPLVACGIVPDLGPMRRARPVDAVGERDGKQPPSGDPLGGGIEHDPGVRPALSNFAVPMIVLVAATILCDADAAKGVMVALGVSFLFLVLRRIMKASDFFDTAFQGFRMMIQPVAVVSASYVLVEANEALGLTAWVIEVARPAMSARLLPCIAFVSMGAVMFATGSFWGVYAVALPVVLPLAGSLGADPYLAAGAVISAGAFGSHCCPWGDSTVLSSAGAGCDNIEHIRTQMPYGLLAAAAAAAGYLILGFATT